MDIDHSPSPQQKVGRGKKKMGVCGGGGGGSFRQSNGGHWSPNWLNCASRTWFPHVPRMGFERKYPWSLSLLCNSELFTFDIQSMRNSENYTTNEEDVYKKISMWFSQAKWVSSLAYSIHHFLICYIGVFGILNDTFSQKSCIDWLVSSRDTSSWRFLQNSKKQRTYLSAWLNLKSIFQEFQLLLLDHIASHIWTKIVARFMSLLWSGDLWN